MTITVSKVLLDLIYIGSLAIIGTLGRPLSRWVKAHTTAKERADLGVLAKIAVPFIERLYPALPGAQKMDKAVAHVTQWLNSKTGLTPKEIEAAVEHAFATAKASGELNVYTKNAASKGAASAAS